MPFITIHTGTPSSVCDCKRPIHQGKRVVGHEDVGFRWIRQTVEPYDRDHVQIVVTLICPLCKTIKNIDWIEPIKERMRND